MFAHLHVHTQYSLLDGLSHIPKLVERAKDQGFGSLAITDHGNLYGVVEFYRECREAGIKPIIGCEVYVAQGSRHDRSSSEKTPYHLTMMARNNTGYRNLMQLVTKAHMEGFYYKPRIDRELLEQYHEGLVVFSGCPTAQVPRLIKEHRQDDARKEALWHKELFGENYFLELQRHAHVEHLDAINDSLVRMSSDLDIPMVVTNDCHYIDQKDAPLQDVLICIHTSTNINDPNRLRMEDESYYLKSAQEMADLFPDHPDAVANTLHIADMCDVTLGFGQLHLPEFPLPEGFSDADEYLAHLCWEGFRWRYPNPPAGAREKLIHELDVIRQTRFANYFLVVWDIVDFTRKNNILLGVRGSAASSVALYCLGVTEINPVEYRLVFERFLNIERKEMPDIDMDFQDDRRDEVLKYVTQRYGSDKVAQIITFGTLGTKASLRDTGRALGMSYASVDRVARLVPFRARTVWDAVENSPELKEIYEGDYAVRDLVEKASGLEGTAHHVSTHAAGVVISSEPLSEYVPLQRPTKSDSSEISMTQYSMEPVAMLGLLKMDFLGLTSLTILDRAIKSVKETRGLEIDLHQLSLDDEETFQLLSSGKTSDIFQLESAGMQRYIKDLKPSTLGDISAMIALYRPGPMEHIDRFIESKHGRAGITYPHPSLEDVLEETYGIIVYQEQVLLILQNFAGYSAGQADIVRKAMGKKNAELMMAERDNFIQGAISNGFDEPLAVEVFNLIEPFAGYAFNKAHSISYALVSYWTAYFKAHYPVEYMGAVLNSRLDHPDRMAIAINDCSQMGIRILPPDVNESGVLFTIEHGPEGPRALRFGMSAVKNVGEGAVQPIVDERAKNGPYSSITEFCGRVDMRSLNRRALESLIKVGTFDAMGQRLSLLDNLGPTLAAAQRDQRIKSTGQSSMFDLMGGGEQEVTEAIAPSHPIVPQGKLSAEELAWEKELLGVALSSNPASLLADIPANGAIVNRNQLDNEMDGQRVKIMGLVSSSEQRYTREQKPYAMTSIEMIGGTLEVIAWPDALEKTRDVWQDGLVVSVSGRLRLRGERLSLHCDEATICASADEPIEQDPHYQEGDWGESEYQVMDESPPNATAIAEPSTNGYHPTDEKAAIDSESPEAESAADNEAPAPHRNGGETAESAAPSGSGSNGGANGYANGKSNGSGNGNGKANGNGHAQGKSNGNGQSNGSTNGNGNGHSRTVLINLHESSDAEEDVQLLNDVKKLLLEYPGSDHVNLTIQTQQGQLRMEWPLVTTTYCEDLQTSLDSLLGQGAVRVEDARPNGN